MKNHIIIADNSVLIRKGLRAILKDSNINFRIKEAEDSKKLFKVLYKNDDAVLIIDYSTDPFSLEDIIRVKNIHPKVKVLAITPYINANIIIQALRAGIDSHVIKDCSGKDIVESIKETARGKKFYCNNIIKNMRAESIDVTNMDFKNLPSDSLVLSDRELQIIGLIAEGYTNAQIAAVLYISNHTVNTHRKNIMKKLGVNNTAGIVMYAVKKELVSPDQFSFNYSS